MTRGILKQADCASEESEHHLTHLRLVGGESDETTPAARISRGRHLRRSSGTLPMADPGGRPMIDLADCCCHAEHLTPREIEVVELVAAGQSNQQIGRDLCLSHYTVASYIETAMRRFDVANRAALVACCYSSGVLDGWPPRRTGRHCIKATPAHRHATNVFATQSVPDKTRARRVGGSPTAPVVKIAANLSEPRKSGQADRREGAYVTPARRSAGSAGY
jgi:DNA-binding CsgD family transcriptional regulator